MLVAKTPVILALVAFVIGQGSGEEALQNDFSFKVRVLGWNKTIGLYEIRYRAGTAKNALAVEDISNRKLNIYQFTQGAHYNINVPSCSIIKVDSASLAKDPLFPIILDAGEGLLKDASTLLRLDGEREEPVPDPFQNTEAIKLKDKKKIVMSDNNQMEEIDFTISFTRAISVQPENRFPVSVKAESDRKILSYEIFDFKTAISDDDFDVPDGCFCETQKDVKALLGARLETPERLQLTRRGSRGSTKGWIDSRFGVSKVEDLDTREVTITDMANNVVYVITANGQCTVQVLEISEKITPAEFVYGFKPDHELQLLKNDVRLGTVSAFVLANNMTEKITNIFMTGQPGKVSAIPLKMTTQSPTSEFTEDFIEGFTEEVNWEDFDVSQCLSNESSDVFRIFFSIENNTEFGSPRDFQYQALGLLRAWAEVKEPLRFINIQPYSDGSLSFEILPARKNSSDTPSLEVAQKIVSLVKQGHAIFTKPDKSQTRVVLVTYETLGAPQATYRGDSVFFISFTTSVLSVFLGLALAVIYIRKVPPQNLLRRKFGV